MDWGAPSSKFDRNSSLSSTRASQSVSLTGCSTLSALKTGSTVLATFGSSTAWRSVVLLHYTLWIFVAVVLFLINTVVWCPLHCSSSQNVNGSLPDKSLGKISFSPSESCQEENLHHFMSTGAAGKLSAVVPHVDYVLTPPSLITPHLLCLNFFLHLLLLHLPLFLPPSRLSVLFHSFVLHLISSSALLFRSSFSIPYSSSSVSLSIWLATIVLTLMVLHM